MTLRSRPGVALAVALFALVSVAAIAHALVVPAVAHRRAVTRATSHAAAASLAEGALATVLSGWPAARWRRHAVGVASEFPLATPPTVAALAIPGARGTVRVRRPSGSTFVVSAAVEVSAAHSPVQALRVLYLELRPDSARTVPALVAGGGVALRADDVVQGDPACAVPAADTVPLVRVAPGSPVVWPGREEGAWVSSDSLAADASTYRRPAGIDLARYLAEAAIQIPGGATVSPSPLVEGGACVVGVSSWGEPRRGSSAVAPCVAAHPVIHAIGDLHLAGERGQGILLVDGALEIAGPFEFQGLIVARGGIVTRGGPVVVRGAVYTSPSAAAAFTADPTQLVTSRCAVQEALDANARIVPIRGWPWAS